MCAEKAPRSMALIPHMLVAVVLSAKNATTVPGTAFSPMAVVVQMIFEVIFVVEVVPASIALVHYFEGVDSSL